MSNQKIDINFDDLLRKNNIVSLVSDNSKKVADAVGSVSFFYYTKLVTFNLIYESKRIWVRNVEQMNDKREFILDKKLDKNKNHYHLLCFSNNNVESIPMWYMYSGVEGNGVRIKFKPSVLRKLINELVVYSPNSSTPLILEKDYKIKAGWIYYKHSDRYYKHRTNYYLLNEFDKKFNKDNMFIKSKHWEYEREFRIVIQNLNNEVYDYLEIDISPFIKELSFMFGPEFKTRDLLKYDNLKNIKVVDNSQFDYSELDISMGLIKNK